MNDSPTPTGKAVVLGTGKLPHSQGFSGQKSKANSSPIRFIIGGALVAIGGLALLVTADTFLDLREDNRNLGTQVASLSDARVELEGQVSFLADIRSRLAAKLGQTETERDALTELATKLEKVNTLIKKDRDIVRDKLTGSKIANAELTKKLDLRETRINELQSIRDRLTTVNLDLKAELETAIARADSLERENTGLQKEIAVLSRSEDNLVDQVAFLEARLSEGLEENGTYAKQVDELLTTVAEKDAELERLQSEITKVESALVPAEEQGGPTAQVGSDSSATGILP